MTGNHFDELKEAAGTAPKTGKYRAVMGYLRDNGHVVYLPTVSAVWDSLDRTVSSCFGSVAHRLRERGANAIHRRAGFVAFLLMVLDNQNQIVWRQQIVPPKELGE